MRAFHLALLLCALSLPAVADDKRILVFGDSVTIGHGDGSVICPDNTSVGGYPPRLRPRLVPHGINATFVNHGLCGEETPDGVTRIDSVLAAGGDVIIIMEGTNDVSRHYSSETILFNLNTMANKAVLAGVEPVMASIIPRGPEANTDTSNGKTLNIGRQLGLDAAENGWAFADPFDALFSRSNFFELYYFDQLHPNPTGYAIIAASMVDATVDAAMRDDPCRRPGPCVASDTVLCFNGGRFRVETRWRVPPDRSGRGHAVPQTDDTGAFFWVNPENLEVTIKLLDGRQFNDYFWVFFAALSNLEYTVFVIDTESGECKEYVNPQGTFASVGDTEAFFDPL